MIDFLSNLQYQLLFYKTYCYNIESIEVSLEYYTKFIIPIIKDWDIWSSPLSNYLEIKKVMGIPIIISADLKNWYKINIIKDVSEEKKEEKV